MSIFWKMCGETKESESLMNLPYGGVQLQITNDKNMFQTMYKWTMEIVNVETELVQESEVSFHLLKENAEEELVLEDNMVAKGKIQYSKEGSSYTIARQQWKIQFMQQSIIESMGTRWNDTYGVFVQEYIQSQISSSCLEEDKLDGEIDELWNLMQLYKKSYNRVKEIVHCQIGFNVKTVEHYNTRSGSLEG